MVSLWQPAAATTCSTHNNLMPHQQHRIALSKPKVLGQRSLFRAVGPSLGSSMESSPGAWGLLLGQGCCVCYCPGSHLIEDHGEVHVDARGIQLHDALRN